MSPSPKSATTTPRIIPRQFASLRHDDMAERVSTEHGRAYRCIEWRCEGMVECGGNVHHAHKQRPYLIFRREGVR